MLRIQSAVWKKDSRRRARNALVHAHLAHRLVHAGQPLVALHDADLEGHVAHAQPRMAEAVGVVLRPAQPAAQEPEQVLARALQFGAMGGAQLRVLGSRSIRS